MTPVVTGPPHQPTTIEAERASAEVTEAVGDQLKSTRATAESWQKGLAGLLGVVTSILLLKGRDSVDEIDHGYVVGAAVILAVAAVAGVFATYQLLDAAYGQPSSQDLTEIRRKSLYVWRHERAVEAARKLRVGQLFLLFSVALVAAAVILAWLAPSPTSTPAYRVTNGSGNCGDLAKATNGRLKIVEDTAAVIIVTDVTRLRIVRSCP